MRTFAELLIDCEEDRTLRAVLAGMLREADHRGALFTPNYLGRGRSGQVCRVMPIVLAQSRLLPPAHHLIASFVAH